MQSPTGNCQQVHDGDIERLSWSSSRGADESELTLTELIGLGAVLARPFKPADLLETVCALLQGCASQGTRKT